MQTIWKCAPMLRLALPFVGGLVAFDLAGQAGLWIAVVFVLAALAVGVGLKAYHVWYHQRHWLGLGIMLLFFVLGSTRMMLYYQSLKPVPRVLEKSTFIIQLNESPVERENSYRCMARLVHAMEDSLVHDCEARILIYFKKSTAVQALQSEDLIMVNGQLKPIEAPHAPGEFDLQKHYAKKRIHHQVYLDTTDWNMAMKPNKHSVQYYLHQWREHALSQLKVYGISGREFGVLSALILGDTSEMDKELMASYSAAGVIHVLAVSGLHVGLVYVLLAPFFKWVFGKSRGRLLRTVLPIAVLWMYSLLTGGSPSVLRAAVMFSGFIFADNFGKHNNIYNTLASSAFVLVMINPAMLFELGFQLSYLAVIGIVVLQKPIYLMLSVKNKWLDKVWVMTAVSLAAQLVTLPLTLYYFHQFPNYFLGANLFIIPWSTLILYISIVFYCCLSFPVLAQLLARVMAWMTRFMNDVIIWFDHLPGSVTTQIECNGFQFICWCCALFFGLRWIFWSKKLALYFLLITLLVAILGNGWNKINQLEQRQCLLHCGKKEWFISHTMADSMRIISPKKNTFGETSYGFANFVREMGIKDQPDTLRISDYTTHVYWINETAIYTADSAIVAKHGILQSDIVMLFDLGKLRLKKWELQALHSCQLVLSSNISRRKMKWISSQLDSTVSVLRMQKGAYVLSNKKWIPFGMSGQ